MSIDTKELNSRLWAEWKNGMKILMESLLRDSAGLPASLCTCVLGNENFVQRAVIYIQRKSYIGKFKDYKTRISAYETTVMELIEQVNKMLAGANAKPWYQIGAPEPTKIEYKSTLADIIIDGDDRLENTEWGDHAIAAFEKLGDYLNNIMNVLEAAQKEIAIPDVTGQDKYDMTINAVAKHYGVTREQILSFDRSLLVATARQIAMYIVRTHNGEPFSSIAEVFGRNSATVVFGVTAIKRRLESEPELRKEVEEIIASVSKL